MLLTKRATVLLTITISVFAGIGGTVDLDASTKLRLRRVLDKTLENQIVAKVVGVAAKGRGTDGSIPSPTRFPEWVAANETAYVYKDRGDWTAGFFPGTIWLLYQRSRDLVTYPLLVSTAEFLNLALLWNSPSLRANKDRTDTHDLGFMMHDSFGWDAILRNNASSRQVVIDAAKALSRRYHPVTKTIRSWGGLTETGSFQVIIDNMMNLEMLYWAAAQTGNTTLSTIATTHALTTQANHFRADGGTWHVINYNQQTGAVISKYTNQGYSDSSVWARGQAWAIYGYVIAWKWTGNISFLRTAQKAADLFLSKLPADGVPYWDFDAPLPAPRDTSAAMVVASGLLYMIETDPNNQYETGKYLAPAIKLLDDTITLSFGIPLAQYTKTGNGSLVVQSIGFESLLRNGTIDNNPTKAKTARNANTGIVYAGYYLVEAQNRLLRLGLL